MNIAALAEKVDEVRTALNGLTPDDIRSKSPTEIRALYEVAHHIRTVRMDVMAPLTHAFMAIVASDDDDELPSKAA